MNLTLTTPYPDRIRTPIELTQERSALAGFYLIDTRYGRVLKSIVAPARARQMVRAGKATMHGRRLYVTNEGEHHPMRTFTSNGRGGQCYTVSDHGKVHDFRFIAPEDLPVFHQATLNTSGLKCEFDYGVT